MMSLIGETKKNNAFTLIEILLVVMIMGIVLALAIPNFSKGFARFQLNKTAEDLLGMSRWAQAMAIGQERIYALTFSGDRRSYQLERQAVNEEADNEEDLNDDNFETINGNLGQMHSIPDAIQLDTDSDRIEFYPDGTIDGATIELDSPQQKAVITSTEMRGMMTKKDDDQQ